MAGPFGSAHMYVQWGGKLPGNEEWSCGFRLRSPGAHSANDAPQLLVGVAAAISAFHSRANSQIHPTATLQFVKVNSIETNGRYSLQTTNEATFGDIPGGGTGSLRPNQVAWAVSLVTGVSRGPAHRGRFYLPLPVCSLEPNGATTASEAGILKGSAEQLRQAVNAVSPGYEMVVMSRKAGSPGIRAVTGIEVGTVLDTQRRRRRSLVEVYA